MAENDLYIPHMTFILCDKGASVMNLMVTPKKHKLYSLPVATDKDNIPLVNIPTFGVCSIDGKPCIPMMPEWKKVHEGAQKVMGQKPLLHTSYCKCQKGGSMKLHFDKAEAQASLDDTIKNRVDGIDWLDEAIGGAVMGPIGSLVSNIMGGEHTTINQDVGRGVRKGLKGTWNFFTDDMWKGETWSAMGKMAAISVVGYSGGGNPITAKTNLKAFDAVFGTDLNQTHNAMIEGIAKSVDEKIINGTGAERGEVFGEVAGGIIEGVVGSKGAGLAIKGLKAGTKLALGAEKFAQITATISKLQQAAKLSNIASKIKGIFKVGRRLEVPNIKEFTEWYNKISSKDFDKLWNDRLSRIKIERRIRHPGGLHEWLMTSRANVFKKWGVKMEEIKKLRTKIDEVVFKNPPGRHGGPGSTKAHNEILEIIDTSKDYKEFKNKLIDWADERLEGGSDSLPTGFFD